MSRPKILLADDDSAILEITARSLNAEGYAVETTIDGEDAVKRVRGAAPDLLLLDVMLPGMDGFEVCREVRKFSNVPIILLTAKTDTVDVVVGLESGADDYVTKPFQMKELVARIRSVLRRLRAQHDKQVVSLGDLEIRPEEGIARKKGVEISLTKTEFLLLCSLASSPGRVFSREQLLNDVWGYDYFGDGRIVDVHIRRLRGKVESDPSSPQIILTVRGLGYKASEG